MSSNPKDPGSVCPYCGQPVNKIKFVRAIVTGLALFALIQGLVSLILGMVAPEGQ